MAIDFDGTNDIVEAASAPVTGVPLTMACWFNMDSITINHVLMIVYEDATFANRFALQADGNRANDPVAAYTTAAGTTNVGLSATGFGLGTWHHGAARFISATNRRAYIDGVGGTTNTTSRTPTGIALTAIGGATTFYANGRIADAAIWNTDLTDAEIAALAKGYRPSLIRPNNLVFFAPLVREIMDHARGLTLTASGGPTVAVHPRRIA